MNDRLYHFSLRSLDLGQMIDGLCARRNAWAGTAKWFRGECRDPYFMIEECSDEHEAQQIADHYSEIIDTLQVQAAPQRGRKAAKPLTRPGEGKTVNGWCLFSDFFFSGPQPVERDDDGFVVHASEREALEGLAEIVIAHSYQFLRGERETLDAGNDMYAVPVRLHANGMIADGANEFNP